MTQMTHIAYFYISKVIAKLVRGCYDEREASKSSQGTSKTNNLLKKGQKSSSVNQFPSFSTFPSKFYFETLHTCTQTCYLCAV